MSKNLPYPADRILFYAIKLPFIYLMIFLGFAFEFAVTLPYQIMIILDSIRESKKEARTEGRTKET